MKPIWSFHAADLLTHTWGNVSGIDREAGLFVIKPSGVDLTKCLTPDDMVVIDMEGNRVEGKYNPSSDTATHLELYKAFPELGGVVHTHSPWATSWAQAGRDIPCYGTTHADYMYGPIPCARNLTPEEINGEYEKNTGLVIIETFKNRNINPVYVPAVLCTNHGPFTWGKNAAEAVHNAVVLEEVAKMATLTELNNPKVQPAPDCIKEKHFMRKHGPNAYYGQPGEARVSETINQSNQAMVRGIRIRAAGISAEMERILYEHTGITEMAKRSSQGHCDCCTQCQSRSSGRITCQQQMYSRICILKR